MIEIFKDIKGYETLYQVSNMGRVKSLGNGNSNNSKERILKPCQNNCNYFRVELCKDGKRQYYFIHRLVAETFIANPNNLPQVNHIDENSSNNRVDNLEWCTREYNNNYGTRNQRVSKANINHPNKSRVVNQYTLDGKYLKTWKSTCEIKRKLGYSNGNISECCLGKRKSAYKYKWSYA